MACAVGDSALTLVGRCPGSASVLMVVGGGGGAVLSMPSAVKIASMSSTAKRLPSVMKRTLVASRTRLPFLTPVLVVSNTRSTLDASPVTALSIFRPCLWHSSLNRLATGNQSSLNISSLSGQYACMPPPECTIHGSPSADSPVSSQNFCSASAAALALGYDLGLMTISPVSLSGCGMSLGWLQSRSTASTWLACMLSLVRSLLVPNVPSAKYVS